MPEKCKNCAKSEATRTAAVAEAAALMKCIKWLWGFYDGNTLNAKAGWEDDIAEAWQAIWDIDPSPAIAALEQERAAAVTEAAALREALKRHGRHNMGCQAGRWRWEMPGIEDDVCTCGYDDVFANPSPAVAALERRLETCNEYAFLLGKLRELMGQASGTKK